MISLDRAVFDFFLRGSFRSTTGRAPCFRTGATNAMDRRTGKAETVKVRDDASVTVERLAGRDGSIIEFRKVDQERGRISGCNLSIRP